MENKRGKLIVIDGTDGSGKKTQTDLLVAGLTQLGYSIEMADFPQYGKKSAALAEEYLNGKFGSAKEVGPYRGSIFFAVDRYAKSPDLWRWIKEGKIVLSNRYASSNMGHQAGKIKDISERDKFLEWNHDLEFNIFGIPPSDGNVLLYMPPVVGQQLVGNKEERGYIEGGKKRDIHESDLQHLADAAEAYLYCAKRYGWRIIDCAPDGTINSLRTKEDIYDELFGVVMEIINHTNT